MQLSIKSFYYPRRMIRMTLTNQPFLSYELRKYVLRITRVYHERRNDHDTLKRRGKELEKGGGGWGNG